MHTLLGECAYGVSYYISEFPQKRAVAIDALRLELSSTYSWVSPVNCTVQRCIALTFDDGPYGPTTSQILGILEKAHVHASFFIVGSRVAGNRSLLRRMYADGDEIGDHSWSHPDLTTLRPDQVRKQVDKTQVAIEATGVPAPTLFRPPYGDLNKMVISNIPLTIMYWNEDPRDWAASTPQQVGRGVLPSAKPGEVVYTLGLDTIG